MNIYLLNPPFHKKYSRSQRSPAVIKSGVMYYPIWLAYAAGVLEKAGFGVQLVDAPARGFDQKVVLQQIDEFKPRLIVLDTSTPSIENDLRIAESIHAKIPNAYIVLVGPHVTALPDEVLSTSSAVNIVARGEYDYTLRDIAECLEDNCDLSAIEGISYRNHDGSIMHNPERPFIKNLDEIPFVSEVYKRHLIIEDYFYSITRYPEVAILTGRGCPYECSYCLWPQTLTGHGYRKRSIMNVADEFEYIARELPQVKEIFIEDDTLTVDQRRSMALSKELIRRGNKIHFTANSRADVSYDTLCSLQSAGLRLVCVGFESGDQQVLDNIKKKITIEQFYQFRAAAQRANVLVHGCFMAGNPGETKETLRKTLNLAKNLNPDTAQFFPIMIYPGTEAFYWATQNGYILTDNYHQWLTEEGLHRTIVDLPRLSAEEIIAWCDASRRSFYLRPRFLLAKIWEIIQHPNETMRFYKASKTFFRYLFRRSNPKKGDVNNSLVDIENK
jgi:anaerobic magnesium-protoporphyrin IX monomethyl ester cyclase